MRKFKFVIIAHFLSAGFKGTEHLLKIIFSNPFIFVNPDGGKLFTSNYSTIISNYSTIISNYKVMLVQIIKV